MSKHLEQYMARQAEKERISEELRVAHIDSYKLTKRIYALELELIELMKPMQAPLSMLCTG